MSARVTIVTAGHLATCPRMLKAADALHGAGYRVRVVSANHTAWAEAADREIAASREWTWVSVDYSRGSAAVARLTTGIRFKAAQGISSRVGAERVPMAVAVRAYSRAHDELVRAVESAPADLIYGGTTGALAAVAEASASLGVPYAVDFEDLHSGEHDADEGDEFPALAARVERSVIEAARFATAGSPLIADAYADRYGVRPTPIHNTFSIAFGDGPGLQRGEMREQTRRAPLRVYWFSQTIGPGRGLDDAVRACGRVEHPIEIHLRGRAIPEYAAHLHALREECAPSLRVVEHPPAAPDRMVALAQPYDAGLSGEEPAVLNRDLCLGNKIFTYLAASVPVIMSRTAAQAQLARDLGDAARTYRVGDVDGLAAHLAALAADADLRRHARAAAGVAALRRWHWEHPLDRGALLAHVASVIQ